MTERARQNEALARRIWEAAATGDPGPVLEFAPAVEWCTYGTGPYAGEYHGLDQVLGYLAKAGQGAEQMNAELLDVYANDRGAILRHRTRFERGADAIESDYFLHLEIEDGMVTRVTSVPFEQALAARFWRVH